jgi:hypothetical protein
MQNLEHITEESFIAYGKRELAAAETLAVQKHISACETCRKKMARKFDAPKMFSALRNDFAYEDLADEPEHLPYERLALFADGKLDDVEREIAESHFAICAECSKDLTDLRSFQTIAAAPLPPEKSAGTQRKTFWRKLFAFDSTGGFAPVAAAFLIAVLFGGWFLLRSNENEIARANGSKATPAPTISGVDSIKNPANNPANVDDMPEAPPGVSPTPENLPNSETLLALKDADGQVTVDENGNVKGLENLSPQAQKAIRQSLQAGRVSVSIAANSLSGVSGGVLMSGGNEENGVPFALDSPIGKVIRESQPVLRWKPLKDATAYSVTVVDDKFRVVADSGKITATSWKPPRALPRGANYSWQVTAIKADGSETVSPASPAPQARFRVVEQTAIDEIGRLEKSGRRSHLALGVLYAQAGLKREARREFEILVRENPKSPLARRLLNSVQGKSK